MAGQKRQAKGKKNNGRLSVTVGPSEIELKKRAIKDKNNPTPAEIRDLLLMVLENQEEILQKIN
ncbi:MAG: hypothetical protein FH756_01490 [Firmicutes bacterium]|nr:hypothetical protein [Bacillota bacterium]